MNPYFPLVTVLILNAFLALPVSAQTLDTDGDGVPDVLISTQK